MTQPPRSQLAKPVAAMMQMKKIDIAAPEAAFHAA
jgi:hypothetical protein